MKREIALITPAELKEEYPMTSEAQATVDFGRRSIVDILNGRDDRLLVITGPCSIHDTQSALEYARKLKKLQSQLPTMLLVMRVYLEKPRTTVGWKGFINDPDRNGKFDMSKGLRKSRELLLNINELGIPVATELLDPLTSNYISDLMSWIAVGARTSESQTHREMVSGLDEIPVGFKNACSGNVKPAINGVIAASHPQSFLGINDAGQVCQLKTSGSKNAHVVLRGGKNPNYHPVTIQKVVKKLLEKGLNPGVIVDCSHDNSGQKCQGQISVLNNVINQIVDQQNSNFVKGIMLESNLKEGKQEMFAKLEYGVSITDECLSWQTTAEILTQAHKKMSENQQKDLAA